MSRLVLGVPQATIVGDGRSRLACRVAFPGLPEVLWVEVADRDSDLFSGLADWAAVAMLYPAMRIGADLEIEGPVSPRLFDALRHDLQPFLQVFDPKLRRIDVAAAACPSVDRPEGRLVATGFSAGIDSFATLARYRFAPVHPSLMVSAIVVFDVGAFGKNGEPHFRRAVSRAEAFAAAQGLRPIAVTSNFDEVYRAPVVGRPGFERTNTFRNAAAALSLANGVGTYLISSTFAPGEIGVRSSYNSAYLDPIILPLLAGEGLTFVSSCAGLTRVEKTRLVADLDEARPLLDVCMRVWERADGRPLNCSHCSKCIRTLFTLESLGRLDAFAAVFDVAGFRDGRTRLLAELCESAAGGNSLDAEVVALMGLAPSRRSKSGLIGRLCRFVRR